MTSAQCLISVLAFIIILFCFSYWIRWWGPSILWYDGISTQSHQMARRRWTNSYYSKYKHFLSPSFATFTDIVYKVWQGEQIGEFISHLCYGLCFINNLQKSGCLKFAIQCSCQSAKINPFIGYKTLKIVNPITNQTGSINCLFLFSMPRCPRITSTLQTHNTVYRIVVEKKISSASVHGQ